MGPTLESIEGLPLERISLFRFVSPESVEGILERCRIVDADRNETILARGRENDELFIVLSGRLRIHLKSPDADPVAFVEVGDVAGEFSIIDGSPTSAFVIADMKSRLLVMEREILWSLVTISHPAAFNLLTILTRRLRNANDLIAEKMLEEHSYHRYGSIDALTGMHNRHWLNSVLPRVLKRAAHSGKPLSVLMIDIDSFKQFNDSFGHLCGDRGIHTVAQAVLDHLRPTEIAARYGGDEFFIILPDVVPDQAWLVAERLRQRVAEAEIVMPDGRTLPGLTISIGIAGTSPEDTADSVIAAADAALYAAKRKGRNAIST